MIDQTRIPRRRTERQTIPLRRPRGLLRISDVLPGVLRDCGLHAMAARLMLDRMAADDSERAS